LWCDKDINIDWGIDSPTLSEKDKFQPKFSEIKKSKSLWEELL